MSDNDESSALLVQAPDLDSGGFSQQGTVDWTSLARSTVNVSVGVLARLSSAGVDPYTMVVGREIAKQFKLSRLGQHRMDSALRNLKFATSIGDALYFGFGMQHTIRTLAQTQEGAQWIMLASALTAVHTTELAARIVAAVVDLIAGEQGSHLTPSLRQWNTLISVCSGTLKTSPFPVVAERMISLASDKGITNTSTSPLHDRICGNPHDMAKAILALSNLTQGSHLAAMTVIGGPGCGWLAAFAYYFFEIDIEIRDTTNKVLQSSGRGRPGLVVIYEGGQTPSLSVIGKTYIIQRFNPSKIHDTHKFQSVSGRVRWETAFQDTFGLGITKRLFTQVDTLGKIIGSAARIYKAIAFAEPELELPELFRREEWCGYRDASFGQGYLVSMMETFAELAPFRPIAESAARTTVQRAVSEYVVSMARLLESCGCKECRQSRGFGEVHAEQGRVTLCMPTLAEFLVKLQYKLTLLTFPPDLLPNRDGLESAYYTWSHTQRDEVGSHLERLFSRLGLSHCIEDAVTIFTGQEVPKDSDFADAAFVVEGLCFYIDPVRELTDDPKVAVRLHIMPGGIQSQSGRQFDRLLSIYDETEGASMVPYPALSTYASVGLPRMKDLCNQGYVVQLVEEETVAGLVATVQIGVDGHHVRFSPYRLLERLISTTGYVACQRRGCGPASSTINVRVIEGEGDVDWKEMLSAHEMAIPEKAIALRQTGRNPIARCIAVLQDSHPYQTLLLRGECLRCAIETQLPATHMHNFPSEPIHIIQY